MFLFMYLYDNDIYPRARVVVIALDRRRLPSATKKRHAGHGPRVQDENED